MRSEGQRTHIEDTKTGMLIEDLTPQLDINYPDLPEAVAEVNRLEAEAKQSALQASQRQAFSTALGNCSDAQLKLLLSEIYGENTRMKSKDKIISHIIDLAEDAGDNPIALAGQYQTKQV